MILVGYICHIYRSLWNLVTNMCGSEFGHHWFREHLACRILWRQAITWTRADMQSIGTYFSDIRKKTSGAHKFTLKFRNVPEADEHWVYKSWFKSFTNNEYSKFYTYKNWQRQCHLIITMGTVYGNIIIKFLRSLVTGRCSCMVFVIHDDVIKWKHFPRYWSFFREFTGHR